MVVAPFSENRIIFRRAVIKSFASPTFSGESPEWNSEINETRSPHSAADGAAAQQTLHDNVDVDAKWGENSPSFGGGGAQECAIHELFHKEDYKLFLSSLFLSFAPFGQSNPSIDQYLFGLFVGATRVTQKILSESSSPLLPRS